MTRTYEANCPILDALSLFGRFVILSRLKKKEWHILHMTKCQAAPCHKPEISIVIHMFR
jgi:hypothetical protein